MTYYLVMSSMRRSNTLTYGKIVVVAGKISNAETGGIFVEQNNPANPTSSYETWQIYQFKFRLGRN